MKTVKKSKNIDQKRKINFIFNIQISKKKGYEKLPDRRSTALF